MAWQDTPAQQALVELVEYRLDQVSSASDERTMPVARAQMYAEAELASDYVLQHAPLRLVMGLATNAAADAQKTLKGDHLRVDLPASFLRLLRVSCAGWLVPVDAFLETGNPAYRLRTNPYAAPDVARPAVYLVPGSPRALELYPKPEDADGLDELYFVAKTPPETLTDALRDATLWDAVRRVAQNVREFEVATKAAEAMALALDGVEIGQAR